MPCVVALTLATALSWRQPAPRVLVYRESVILARDPLPDEVDPSRPAVRAIIRLSGPTTLYVTQTPDEVLVTAPCVQLTTTVNTPRVATESRPTP